LATSGWEKNRLCCKENLKWKKLIFFLNLNWNFLFLNFKKFSHTTRGKWEQKNRFWNLNWNLKIFEICHEKMKWNEKFENFCFWNETNKKIHFWNLKWKFMFEIWFFLAISLEGNEKKLKWRNHIFHLCHGDKTFNNTLIPPYTTGASCGGIQLISVVGSFHIDPFPTVV
jgi:hypothetical protein